jgi:hypothetical protein
MNKLDRRIISERFKALAKRDPMLTELYRWAVQKQLETGAGQEGVDNGLEQEQAYVEMKQRLQPLVGWLRTDKTDYTLCSQEAWEVCLTYLDSVLRNEASDSRA